MHDTPPSIGASFRWLFAWGLRRSFDSSAAAPSHITLTPPPKPPSRPNQSPLASIPQFYYPGGQEPLSDDARATFASRVDALFSPHPDGLNLEQFSRVVQEVCGLPTILAHPWFERLVAGRPARLVERSVFTEWWAARGLVPAAAGKRLWEVLRPEGRNYLTYDDFKPLLQVCVGVGVGGCLVVGWL
jgi:hypothetical protein